MIWLYQNAEVDLGYLPSFLSKDDPRPAKEQINANYCGGWLPLDGCELLYEDLTLTYPGDPPLNPIAGTNLRHELIIVYPNDIVMIIQPDHSFEVARID